MNPLEPAELSALLDGELDPRRAAEIQALIAADPAVRAEYDSLRLADARLRTLAGPARFAPWVSLPAPSPRASPAWLAAPALIVPLGWLVGKLTEAMSTAVAVNSLSLLVLIASLSLLAARELRRDGRPAPQSR